MDIPVVTVHEDVPNQKHEPREERQCFAIPAFCPGLEEYAHNNAMVSAAVIQKIVGDQIPVGYTTHDPHLMKDSSHSAVGSLTGGWVLIDAKALGESEEARTEISRHGREWLEEEASKMSLENAKKILGIAKEARREFSHTESFYPPAAETATAAPTAETPKPRVMGSNMVTAVMPDPLPLPRTPSR